jgi:hypothetical protein
MEGGPLGAHARALGRGVKTLRPVSRDAHARSSRSLSQIIFVSFSAFRVLSSSRPRLSSRRAPFLKTTLAHPPDFSDDRRMWALLVVSLPINLCRAVGVLALSMWSGSRKGSRLTLSLRWRAHVRRARMERRTFSAGQSHVVRPVSELRETASSLKILARFAHAPDGGREDGWLGPVIGNLSTLEMLSKLRRLFPVGEASWQTLSCRRRAHHATHVRGAETSGKVISSHAVRSWS